MNGNIESVSIAGAPTIEFKFAGDTCRAELAGAKLYAEGGRPDGGCDLRITDATGFVLANLAIYERPERNMTENLIDIGSALLWSHWRHTQSAPMSSDAEKHTSTPTQG